MKKNYVIPVAKTIRLRFENNILEASPTGTLGVTDDENNEGYDAKEEMSFGW